MPQLPPFEAVSPKAFEDLRQPYGILAPRPDAPAPPPPPFTPAQEARMREIIEQTLVAELTRQEEWTRLEIQRSTVDLAQRLLDAVASPARLPTIEAMMRMRDVYARQGLRPSWDEHGRVLTFPIPEGEDPFSCEPIVIEGRFGGWRKAQPVMPIADAMR